MRNVRCAAVQMRCSRNVAENIEKAEALVRQAAAEGAQVILLPELFERQYFCQERRYDYYQFATPVMENPAVRYFQRVCASLGVVIPVSFYERDVNRLFNSVAMIDADGSILGVYRKTHIPDDHFYQEKFYFTPGDTGFKVFDKLSKAFPEVIENGKISSEKLASIVFNNKDKLDTLNSITHPGTIEEILNRIEQSNNSIIVVESALLLGSGLEYHCDELWYVYCEHNERVNRLVENRGYSVEKSEEIISNQPSDEEYNHFADEFIDNTFSVEKTREQIDMILSNKEC